MLTNIPTSEKPKVMDVLLAIMKVANANGVIIEFNDENYKGQFMIARLTNIRWNKTGEEPEWIEEEQK